MPETEPGAVAAPPAPPAAPPAPEAVAPPEPVSLFPSRDSRIDEETVPGLRLKWGEVKGLGLTDDFLIEMLSFKKDERYSGSDLAIIPTDDDNYLVRGCTRLEWRKRVAELGQMDDTQERLQKEGHNSNTVQNIMTMIAEDKLVKTFLIHPAMELAQIRLLPPGEVKVLHDGIMMHLGYGQPVRAFKI